MSTNSNTKPVKKPSEPRQSKKKADPKYSYNRNKAKEPKRNKSAFLIFSTQIRAKLKEQGQKSPNANEMMIKLAEMWKNLSKKERKPYEEEARLDKIRYCEELENFWKDNPSQGLNNKTKANHVKKPCSAYGLFLKDIKDEVKAEKPGMKMSDVLKIVSDRWKTLDKPKRAYYQDKAKKEKEEAQNRLNECRSRAQDDEEDYEKMKALRIYVMRKKIKSLPKGTKKTKSKAKGRSNLGPSEDDFILVENEDLRVKIPACSDFPDCSPTVESSIIRTELTPKSNRDSEAFQFEDTPNIIQRDFVDEMLNFECDTISFKDHDDIDFSGKNFARACSNPFFAQALELEIPPLECTFSKTVINQSFQNMLDSEDFTSSFMVTQINSYANFISQKLSWNQI